MAPRKKRRLPKLPPMRNTNEVIREQSSFLDFFIVVVAVTVVLPLCIYCFG